MQNHRYDDEMAAYDSTQDDKPDFKNKWVFPLVLFLILTLVWTL